MKRAKMAQPVLPLTLLMLATACREQTATPDTLLYRPWLLTTIAYDGQPQEPSHYIRPVTFPRNGDFRDGLPDDSRWCCSPGSFEAIRTTLRFIWNMSNPICAHINCLVSPLTGGVTWQIDRLTVTSLGLKNDRRTLTFIAIP